MEIDKDANNDHFEVRDMGRSRRQQLPDEVATYVRGLIISGTVQPGEYLRLDPIAEAVGVSNTPVREGLLSLRSGGFVRLVPRKGFVVAPFTRQDVRDLFWAQAQLAGELAARAAVRTDEDQVRRLADLHDRHEQALEAGDLDAVSNIGHAFHRGINKCADSPRLALLLNSIVQQLPPQFYVQIEGHPKATVEHHRSLVTAIGAGDAKKARSVMQEHVLQGADYLVGMLEERGVFDDESTPEAAAPASG